MQAETMPPRESVHVIGELDKVSKDKIVVVGGPYYSGTVLGEMANGQYRQLDISVDATEADTATHVLYGHKTSTDEQECIAHARVCALYSSKLVWPDGITDDQKKAAEAALKANQVVLR